MSVQESTKNPQNNIEVSEKQADFLKTPNHSFNILSGVTSSGKTYVQAMKFMDFVYNEAERNSLHILSGRTSESLHDNLIRPILEMDRCHDIEVKGSPAKMTIKSKNIECRLVGCDNDLAEARIRGKSVWSWWADEITKHPEGFVKQAIVLCRAGGLIRPKFWTCNPDNPQHFVKRDYMDSPTLDVANWYFGFPDNPTLSAELLKELKTAFSGVFYDRMILGKWTIAEGAVYDRFDRSLHVVDDIPWRTIVDYGLGIDWGYSEALALTLYAIDNDDRYYQIDEYQESGKNIDKALIDELGAKGWWELPITRWDGATWQTWKVKPGMAYADSNRPEYVDTFGKLTGIPTYPAIKPSKAELIQTVQRKHVADGQGKYGIYYLKGKTNKTIAQKEGYRWKPGSHDDVIKENDHLCDCEQYFIFTKEHGRVRFAK